MSTRFQKARSMEPPRSRAEEHVEALLDEALEETFPASDPISPAVDQSLLAVRAVSAVAPRSAARVRWSPHRPPL